jgi:hypothetical protein
VSDSALHESDAQCSMLVTSGGVFTPLCTLLHAVEAGSARCMGDGSLSMGLKRGECLTTDTTRLKVKSSLLNVINTMYFDILCMAYVRNHLDMRHS